MGLFDSGGGLFGSGGALGQVGNITLSAIPGVGSYLGQTSANDANMAINSANNAFNADQAAQNRAFQTASQANAQAFSASQVQQQDDFQASQSANAMQTRVADLTKAGLNPALAMGNGAQGAQAMSGSSASSNGMPGSTASAAAQPVMRNALADSVGSAQTLSSIYKTFADVRNTNAQTDNINQDTQNKVDSNPLLHGQLENLIRTGKLTDAQKLLTDAQTASELNRPSQIKAQTSATAASIPVSQSQVDVNKSTTEKNNSDSASIQAGTPAKQAESDFQSGPFGAIGKFIQNLVAPTLQSAGAASRVFNSK